MGTDIAPNRVQLSIPPAPIALPLARAVRFCASRLTEVGLGHDIRAEDAPSAPQREAMRRRADMLAVWLAPAGPAALVDEMAKIMLMPSRTGTADDAKVLIKLYAADLADLPVFAVVRACADFRQGRAGDARWRPTQGEIRIVAEAHIADVARERRAIRDVLTARIVAPVLNSDPERRKALAAEMRRVVAAGAVAAEAVERGRHRVPPRVAAIETPEQFATRMASPPRLSDEARRTMEPVRAEAAA